MSEESLLETVGDYKPGSIKRIKLKNFLTYADVEFQPGPRLNMVVGPNGTGKSTILNAICLGLGGEPKLLGRADDARAFIMHGKSKAEIEIELAPQEGEEEPHVFRRVIDRNKGSERGRGRGASTFFVNDEAVSASAVREIVAEQYNISIDNLCTFLPQDKVGNFSGFDSKQLLIETEKTLSSSQHLYKAHQELIELEEDLKFGVNDVENLQSKINKLKREYDVLELEKKRAEDREKALEQADLLNKKKVWLEFEHYRDQAMELKEKRAQIKEEVKQAKAEIQPLEDKQQQLASQKKEMEAKFKSLDQTTSRCRQEMEKQKKKYENHDDQIEDLFLQIRELGQKRLQKEQKYEETKKRVEQLEAQLATLPAQDVVDRNYEEARAKLKEASRTYEKAKRDARVHVQQLRELEDKAKEFQQKLARMNDEGARRKERIFRQHPQLNKIHQWLEKNRKLFRRSVWGPIMCEVTTKSQNAAAYLEQHVPNRILKAFVVETKEDYDKFYRIIREEKKIPINILLIENGKLEPLHGRIYSDQKMKILKKEHGVIGFLDEAFTAPDPVMQALRLHAGVHKTLVGGDKTQDSVDNKGLIRYLSEPDSSLGQHELQPSCIFTSKGDRSFKYTQTISRYSAQEGSRVDDILPAKMLAPGVNPRAKKDAEDKLAAVHADMEKLRPDLEGAEKTKGELERETQEHSARTNASKQQKENLGKFMGKLNAAKRKFKDAEADLATDDEKERKAMVKSLKNRISHSISALEAHAEQHQKMMQSTIASAGVNVSKNGLAAAERKARQELIEKQKQYTEIEQEAARIQNEFTEAKKKVKTKKDEAEAAAPIVDRNGNELPLKKQLDELEVATLHEVEAALEEAEQKANSIDANPEVIRQYEQLKAEIEETQAKLAEVTDSKDIKTGLIETKRMPWEAALEKCVVRINSLFTKYMQEMQCTGEVKLTKGEPTDEEENNTGNFKDWGIQILVSFRENTKAQVLSARVQSGGERSVSTIMYLMALQDMMVAPFRCVDEINQGLDDRNERLVFRRIVENSTRKPKDSPTDHAGQYFLITPKLLPNLYDMEEDGMTVLFVFNGPFNFKSPKEWDVGHLLSLAKGKKRAVASEEDDEDENSGNTAVQQPKSKKNRPSLEDEGALNA